MPPLSGIRVLDFSTTIAGPLASLILSDLGADVIKVERPDGGDDARHMGPRRGSWSTVFVSLNCGKRSIVLDLARPEARQVVLRLVRGCDVWVENFRGAKMAALGLDEASVRIVQPNIIYASLSAYGSRGPDAGKPGYDALLQARSGICSVTGAGPGAGPGTIVRAGVSLVDMGAGMWLALGILAALLERRESGKGQRVESSLLETGIMLMAYHLLERQFTGIDPMPQGSRHGAFAPYCAFDTADAPIMIGVSNDRIFRRLCDALGRSDWLQGKKAALYATNALRVRNREPLEAALAEIVRQRPAAHWLALFDAHDVPAAPIQNASQVLADPQLAAIGQLQSVLLPEAESPAAVPRLPLGLSRTPAARMVPPPRLGEHGRDILREAGYDAAEIESLAATGACHLP